MTPSQRLTALAATHLGLAVAVRSGFAEVTPEGLEEMAQTLCNIAAEIAIPFEVLDEAVEAGRRQERSLMPAPPFSRSEAEIRDRIVAAAAAGEIALLPIAWPKPSSQESVA